MKIKVRSIEQQMIDTFKEYIETEGNLEMDYSLDEYIKIALNYISDLKRENQELKQKINTYENPNDLTLMFMYCNEKARDMIEELKKELKGKDDFINKLQATKDRLDKYDYERTNQQKEFIEYLESEIKRLEENNIYEPLQRTALATFQHVLSKYKEIIGGKHE